MAIQTVLITGAAGYIGSTVTRRLLAKGYKVLGLDLLLYGEQGIQEFASHPRFKLFKADIRDQGTSEAVMGQVDAVIHLAAIVGMPVCEKYPELADETNRVATQSLFDCASKTGSVQRFLFPSSTSVYGAVQTEGFVDETSPTQPLSLYAELKLQCEDYVLHAPTRNRLVPTVLRFPTAYGLSGRMRFDLTVNEFTRDLTVAGAVKIFGEGCWRPYCHVEDVAQACLNVLEAPDALIDREVYCVGDASENYTKQMLCQILQEIVPDGKVIRVPSGDDPRDYRVDCSKIRRLGFQITKTVRDGIREISQALRQGRFHDPFDHIYTSVLLNPAAAGLPNAAHR